MADKYIKSILSLTRRVLLLIPIYMILNTFDFFNNFNVIKIVIILLLTVNPFFTNIIENKKIHLKRLGTMIFFLLPSVIIGLLATTLTESLEVGTATSIFTSIFGFGITVVIICFQFSGTKHKSLVTSENRIYFSDFLLTMIINAMFVIYFMITALEDSILLMSILSSLQIYTTLHYYIRELMENQ